MAEWADPDDFDFDERDSYATPEEAARGDIPEKYSPVLFVDLDPSGEYAVVLLGTDEEPDLYPYEEFCRKQSGRWYSMGGSNGSTQFVVPGRFGLFTDWGEAPAGATAARVTFQGKTHDCPVERGFYRLTVWDWDEEAYEARGEELDWLMLKQAKSETRDGSWTVHMDRGMLEPKEAAVWDEHGTQRHPDVEFL